MIIVQHGTVYDFLCQWCGCHFRQTAKECVATGIGSTNQGRAYCPTCGNDVIGDLMMTSMAHHAFPIANIEPGEVEK